MSFFTLWTGDACVAFGLLFFVGFYVFAFWIVGTADEFVAKTTLFVYELSATLGAEFALDRKSTRLNSSHYA